MQLGREAQEPGLAPKVPAGAARPADRASGRSVGLGCSVAERNAGSAAQTLEQLARGAAVLSVVREAREQGDGALAMPGGAFETSQVEAHCRILSQLGASAGHLERFSPGAILLQSL